MKKMKRVLACLLVMIMCMGMSTSVFASKESEKVEWQSFPSQKETDEYSKYAVAAQRFLHDYSSVTRKIINDSNGCNGYFGSGSVDALKKYQAARGLSPDGSCGPNTWGDFFETLDYSGRTYVSDSIDGNFYAYKKTVGYTNIMVRKGTGSGYWYIRTSHPAGTTEWHLGTYTIFDR